MAASRMGAISMERQVVEGMEMPDIIAPGALAGEMVASCLDFMRVERQVMKGMEMPGILTTGVLASEMDVSRIEAASMKDPVTVAAEQSASGRDNTKPAPGTIEN